MTALYTALISAGASVIVGLLSLVGIVLTGNRDRRQIEQKITVSQAVTETKLEALTLEVRRLGGISCRLPIMEEQLRMADHRLNKLEGSTDYTI